jgi:phage baseplate assembly protein V
MNPELAEIERRLSNLIRVGTVAEVDTGRARVRIDCAGLTTDWLPWLTRRAGGDIDWWAPEVGEQVVIFAPSGLIEDAFVLPALYSDSRAEPESSLEKHTIRYANGDSVTHDRAAGSFSLKCSGDISIAAGGAVTVTAGGDVRLTGAAIKLNE